MRPVEAFQYGSPAGFGACSEVEPLGIHSMLEREIAFLSQGGDFNHHPILVHFISVDGESEFQKIRAIQPIVFAEMLGVAFVATFYNDIDSTNFSVDLHSFHFSVGRDKKPVPRAIRIESGVKNSFDGKIKISLDANFQYFFVFILPLGLSDITGSALVLVRP